MRLKRSNMNVQNIFDALQEDLDNTALGIVSVELGEQGYKVRIEGSEVDSGYEFLVHHAPKVPAGYASVRPPGLAYGKHELLRG